MWDGEKSSPTGAQGAVRRGPSHRKDDASASGHRGPAPDRHLSFAVAGFLAKAVDPPNRIVNRGRLAFKLVVCFFKKQTTKCADNLRNYHTT